MICYFDNSATTKPYDESIQEMSMLMREYWGNPSSAHEMGNKSHKKMKQYRENISEILNCSSNEITFTSGGTEGNNLALKGVASPGKHIITTNIEHPSVRATIDYLKDNGCEVTVLKVNRLGLVDIDELEKNIKSNTVLVSIMHMNNEVGILQDVESIGNMLKNKYERVKFHVDAVQSFCKHKLDVKAMKVDFLTTSAHKHHGPRGVGIVYIRKGIVLKPHMHGSKQESGVRAGTENLYTIGGMVKSAEIMSGNMRENNDKVYKLKEYFIERLGEIKDVRINSPLEPEYSPYVLNICVKGTPSEVLVRALSDKGIYISKGSACSSKSESASHVLEALGLREKEVKSAVRISFCEENTLKEIDYTIDELKKIATFLRKISI